MVKPNRCSTRVDGATIPPDPPLSKVRRLQPLIDQIVFHEFSHRPFKEHSPCFLVPAEPLINLFARRSFADPNISVACGTQRIAGPANHLAHCAPTLYIPW